MKRPFEEIKEIYSENLERVRENQLRNFENSEKFMLWIVGFAIGGLSLIVSNLAALSDRYDSSVIKIVLIALTVSIVSGIIYRWAFYSFQIQYQQVEYFLKGAFSNRKSMSTSYNDLSAETDYAFMVFKMNNDFGIDLNHLLEPYENANAELKAFLIKDIKTQYYSMSKLAVEDYDFAMNYVDGIFKKAFGLSDKKLEKLKNKNYAKLLKIYGRITTFGFVISCLSFMFVIILLTALY